MLPPTHARRAEGTRPPRQCNKISTESPCQLFAKPNNISNLRKQTVFGRPRPQQAPRNAQYSNHEKAAKHIVHLTGGDRNHGARPYLTRARQRVRPHPRPRLVRQQSPRFYDSLLLRTNSIDKKADDYNWLSPYLWCAANPIRFTDFNGEEYGDTFSTKDSAAIDFGMIYNRLSILFNIEYTTNIYSFTKPNGELAYSYTLPQKGTSKTGGNPIDPQYGETIVARAHTHAAYDRKYNNDVFSGETSTAEGNRHSSDGDLLVYNLTEVDGYVSTPNGSLRKYDYNTGVVSIISTQMPNDFRDKSSSMYEELILLLNQLKDAINHK